MHVWHRRTPLSNMVGKSKPKELHNNSDQQRLCCICASGPLTCEGRRPSLTWGFSNSVNAIFIILRKNVYVRQEVSFTEHEIILRQNYYQYPGNGAPLEGGACWLGQPSFYVSLALVGPPPPGWGRGPPPQSWGGGNAVKTEKPR